MGRVFSINFKFEEKVSNALVCMYEKGYNILFKVHVFDEDLYEILPAGNLIFSYAGGLETPVQLNEYGRRLVTCLTDEVSRYLHAEEQPH